MAYRKFVRGLPTVLSINDSLSRTFELKATYAGDGQASPLVVGRLKAKSLALERSEFGRFDAVHVVSREESQHLASSAGLTNVHVIPVSMDDAFLRVPPAGGSRPVTILTSGNLAVPSICDPLCSFMSRYWRRIRENAPETKFVVVGGRAAPAAARQLLASMEGVVFHDWVEDYVGVLARIDMCVFFDARAGGMKNRVMQALAAGRPVIGTSMALEGVAGQDGTHFFRVDDLEESFDRLSMLVASRDLRARIGDQARDLILTRYSQEATGREWEHLYIAISGKRQH